MASGRCRGTEVLVIDGQERFRRRVIESLSPIGYEVFPASSWLGAQQLIAGRLIAPDVVLIEPAATGPSKPVDLAQVCGQVRPAPVVVLSSRREPGTIVEAIKAGASDYICKPIEAKQLQHTIRQALDAKKNGHSVVPQPDEQESEFVFCNERMLQIRQMILQMADIEVPVLIHGQTGVGKDILARMIHASSPRASRRYVKVNCAALPSGLVESELFGHEKGAFTGAHGDRPGKFEFARGGTIFLDEVTEFSPEAQAKLLQVLQEKKFTRLGGNREIEADVRIVAASNRNIEEAIEQGVFREDLYYRLNVVNIEVPPLRQRKDEIEALSRHFLRRFAREFDSPLQTALPAKLLQAFQAYHWPGNVRELENVVKRYVVLQDADSICAELSAKTPDDLLGCVDEITENALSSPGDRLDLRMLRRQAVSMVEKSMIRKALLRSRWNKRRTASYLGVSYKTLLSKIAHYEIRP